MPLALVVEDDAGLCTIYRRVLSNIGYDVLEAMDGEVALELLESYTPNVIFLDILLPRVNGLVVLDYIQNSPHLEDSHVVIVSSNRRFEKEVIDLPSVEFILKPIRPAQIQEIAQYYSQV